LIHDLVGAAEFLQQFDEIESLLGVVKIRRFHRPDPAPRLSRPGKPRQATENRGRK
jgi:hypothetical protein